MSTKDGPAEPKRRIIPFVLIAIGMAMVSWHLDANCLWEDEAQTAVVAKNILATGVPAASDGKNLVSIFADHRDIRDGIYIWQGWFPSYLAAGAMALFGRNGFGARFPFAIAFAVLAGFYFIFLRRHGHHSRQHAWIVLVLTVTCVPLLLHSRQCRYYALLPLLNLLVIDSYLSILKSPKLGSVIALVVRSTILLNSFFPGAFLLSLALTADLIRRRPSKAVLKKLAAAALVIIVLYLPIAWFCRIWDRRFGAEFGFNDPAAWGWYLLRYLLTLNNYFFPCLIGLLGILLSWKSVAKKIWANDLNFLFLAVCVTQLIGFSILSDYPFTRYIIGIVPFVMFFGASCIEAISFNRQWLTCCLTVVIATTNFLHILPLPLLRQTPLEKPNWTTAGIDLRFIDPENIRSSFARGEIKSLISIRAGFPILDYWRSIIRPPSGPIDEIVQYLKGNASPLDRVKISYGDLPLMFHTNLAISGPAETGQPGPEWIVSRHFRPLRTDNEFFRENSNYRYIKTEIPFPDLQWNNQPDPLYHYYDSPSPELAPPVAVLHKF